MKAGDQIGWAMLSVYERSRQTQGSESEGEGLHRPEYATLFTSISGAYSYALSLRELKGPTEGGSLHIGAKCLPLNSLGKAFCCVAKSPAQFLNLKWKPVKALVLSQPRETEVVKTSCWKRSRHAARGVVGRSLSSLAGST
jgi:hypothetical protein